MTFFLEHVGLAIGLVVALGAAAQWLAWRVGLPAILPLLIIGFFLGPVLGLVNPTDFVSEDLLFPAISLAVGLILFEGGLTLRFSELREIRGVVRRLVSVGALVTWLGATAAGHYIVGLNPGLSFLFGALVMVTGPTVIGPLLRIVRPTSKVGNVLKWEGILIDPIGAMVAVLVFEYLVTFNRSEALGQVVLVFLKFVGVGGLTGVVGGLLLAVLLSRRLVPDYLVSLVALGFVFLVFAVSGTFAEESGLLATTIMGIILANRQVPNIKNLLNFKEDLTVLFISLLFIVLAANIELDTLLQVLDFSTLLLLAALMLVVRPLSIFISTIGSDFTVREKLYLSWIAPRGIVAAAVSSLFAAELVAEGATDAAVLAPLVFTVIVGTVLLNSLTAKPVARLLGIAEPDPQGFLIMGAHPFARRIAEFLKGEGVNVLLSDTNWQNVSAARVEGLDAYYGSLLSERSDDELRLSGIGRLLALTSNDEANGLAALKYAREFDSLHVYQLKPGRPSERDQISDESRGRLLFHKAVTYAELSHLFSRGAKIKKTNITERFNLADFEAVHGTNYLPMFVINGSNVRVLAEDDPIQETTGTLVALVLEPEPEEVLAATA